MTKPLRIKLILSGLVLLGGLGCAALGGGVGDYGNLVLPGLLPFGVIGAVVAALEVRAGQGDDERQENPRAGQQAHGRNVNAR